MMAIIQDMQGTLLRLSCQLDVKKKVEIDSFFPIKNDSDMQRFLDKTDGMFHLRREEFENLVYCNVTESLKLKRPFESTLFASLFSREFISGHRWPGPRYTYELSIKYIMNVH